jgi:hypothetical protein
MPLSTFQLWTFESARINLLCEGNLVISRSVEANKDTWIRFNNIYVKLKW